MCLFCGNSTRGRRCEYCRQQPNGKQLSHLIEWKTPTSTCFECSCSGQTYDCRTNSKYNLIENKVFIFYFQATDGCWCLSHLLDSNSADLNLYQCLSNRTYINSEGHGQCRSRIHQQCNNCGRGYHGVTSERGHRCYKFV